ncbi:MAG TPA: plastocyanin/azurin family copper-binding protein [Candidatus Nitrosotalea sp.]|nr:plastocyanin/azurin family copper-binding protein [Candidatus Nitrosotalea sp.]
MKYVFLFLMVIAGLVATTMYLPNAYSDFSSNGKYLIDASGYLAGNKTIFDSNIALQITAGANNGTSMQATLDNGLVTVANTQYLNSGLWQVAILRDNKYFVIQGNAQDENGNMIHLNLFGRIIGSNQDGSVFTISGKITGSETMKASYSAKVLSAGTVTTKPITSTTPSTTTTTPSSSTVVNISILQGASNINNQVHYSPSNVQVALGTTIVWTNNDLVPHRIMSGVASALTTNQSTTTLTSDGKIDSGVIAPGQSFQYTITSFDTTQSLDPRVAARYNIPQDETVGDITFFDPTYQFMVGIIAPLSQSSTMQAQTAQMSILNGATNSSKVQFLSPSSLQITPGTVVVWTNNDSVPHSIMSGQLISTTESAGGKGAAGQTVSPHFISDGNINSGPIAPGQSYQTTFSRTGSTQIFDPSYTWINGIIISSPATTTQIAPVKISINPGSSSAKGSATQQTYNQYNTYYTPDTIQIVPGTPIIWTNNDSIAHTIYSGVSTQKNTNPFTPDGKIASGTIAPGQTFMVIVNDTGIVRFYDPQYTWMNGLIISMPPTSSYVIGNAPPQ